MKQNIFCVKTYRADALNSASFYFQLPPSKIPSFFSFLKKFSFFSLPCSITFRSTGAKIRPIWGILYPVYRITTSHDCDDRYFCDAPKVIQTASVGLINRSRRHTIASCIAIKYCQDRHFLYLQILWTVSTNNINTNDIYFISFTQLEGFKGRRGYIRFEIIQF